MDRASSMWQGQEHFWGEHPIAREGKKTLGIIYLLMIDLGRPAFVPQASDFLLKVPKTSCRLRLNHKLSDFGGQRAAA